MNIHINCGIARYSVGASGLPILLIALMGCSGGGGSETTPGDQVNISPPSNAPDLVVSSLNVESSRVVDTGDPITISARVRNSGTADSGSTELRYYLSTDSTINNQDTELGSDTVESLSPDDETEDLHPVDAPSVAGTYYYGACVSPVANESDTQNNCSSGFQLRVGGTRPDLTADLTYIDTQVNEGDRLQINVTVTNIGDADSPSTDLRIYRSEDAVIGGLQDTQVHTNPVSSLSPGETDTEPLSFTPSSVGTYYYGACVQPVSDESDIDNNCTEAVRVAVGDLPDVVVWEISTSESRVNTGDDFRIDTVVRNIGRGNAPSTRLRYYRSTDSTVTRNDTEVGTRSVSSLRADETYRDSITLSAPSRAGTYYYGACVDPVPDESDTGNNCTGRERLTVTAHAYSALAGGRSTRGSEIIYGWTLGANSQTSADNDSILECRDAGGGGSCRVISQVTASVACVAIAKPRGSQAGTIIYSLRANSPSTTVLATCESRNDNRVCDLVVSECNADGRVRLGNWIDD